MNVGSLFSGIGGIDLGLERAGLRVAWQCESDPFCQRVLRHRWPGLPLVYDVRLLEFAYRAGIIGRVDVLAGGFPCQPVSSAGLRRGTADPRWLWPAFQRAIRLLRPRYVIVENVPGLLRRGMGDVLGGLAEEGFDAEWLVFGARDVGAPHRRDRVWIVAWRADTHGLGCEGVAAGHGTHGGLEVTPGHDAGRLRPALADTNGQRRNRRAGHERATGRREPADRGDPGRVADADGLHAGHEHPRAPAVVGPGTGGAAGPRDTQPPPLAWLPEPAVGRVADGVPDRVDRLRALGNAVVPQCAEEVGRFILSLEGR